MHHFLGMYHAVNMYMCLLLICVFAIFHLDAADPLVTPVSELLDSYDYVIVGAGTSGAVLASRLSENPGVRVLVLEAGGVKPPKRNADVVGIFRDFWNSSVNWNYQTIPQRFSHAASENRVGRLLSGKCLGGSSVTNGLQYARGCRHDYDRWKSSGCDGWDYDSILPYFLKSENIHTPELKASRFHGSGGFLDVSDSSNSMLSNVFVNSGEALGYNFTDINSENNVGLNSFFGTFRKGERVDTYKNLLKLAMGRSNVHVLTNAPVTKILFSQKVASAVQFVKDGKEHTVQSSKEILVSAGAIGSAKLLMLSGVGPPEHLKALNIPVISGRPVGQNLQDHIQLPIWVDGKYPGYVRQPPTLLDWFKYNVFGVGNLAEPGYSGTLFYSHDGPAAERPDVMVNMVPYKMSLEHLSIGVRSDLLQELKTASQGSGVTFLISLLYPKSRGEVKLQSANYLDEPLIDPNYLKSEEDALTIARAVNVVFSFLGESLFRILHFDLNTSKFSFCEKHDFNSTSYWLCLVRHLAVSMNHATGTCKMGKASDPSAVVDSSLRVIGTERLRVIDSSIIPEITSGSSNAPVIMVAEKAADMILSE